MKCFPNSLQENYIFDNQNCQEYKHSCPIKEPVYHFVARRFGWETFKSAVWIEHMLKMKYNSVLTAIYHLSPTLCLCTWNVCRVYLSLLVFVFFGCVCPCAYLPTCLYGLVMSCLSVCLSVCVCVQWGEDGCSVSSNRAGWTGWLCQPPRSTGSASEQRKWNHTREKVMRERERGMWRMWVVKHKNKTSSRGSCLSYGEEVCNGL